MNENDEITVARATYAGSPRPTIKFYTEYHYNRNDSNTSNNKKNKNKNKNKNKTKKKKNNNNFTQGTYRIPLNGSACKHTTVTDTSPTF